MQGGTAGPGSRGAGRASPLYLWREVMQSDPLLGVRARTELNRQRGDACAGDARVLRSLAAVLFDAVVPTPLSRARRQAGEAIPLWVFDADRGACLVSPGDVDLLGEGGSHCIGERLEGAGVWTRSSAILTGRVLSGGGGQVLCGRAVTVARPVSSSEVGRRCRVGRTKFHVKQRQTARRGNAVSASTHRNPFSRA